MLVTRTSRRFRDFYLLFREWVFGVYYLRCSYFGSFHRDAFRLHLRRRHVDAKCPMTLVTDGETEYTDTGSNYKIHR